MAKIAPVKSLDDSNQAGLLGIKSRFLMEYGPFETTDQAIKHLRKSIELDDSVPLWHFYLGKCLARYRRANAYNDLPSEEELSELEKAFANSKTPDKGVMLLETYGETLKFSNMSRKLSCNKDKIERNVKDLLNFIQNCTGDEWYVYWRCALVAMKLPSQLVRKEQIKMLIDIAIESSDRNHNTATSFLNSIQSKYYKIYEKNLPKALSFSEAAAAAGEFPSCIEVLLLKYRINNEEDLIPVINKFIVQGNLNKAKTRLLLIKATYLMFVKNCATDAMELYLEVMKEDCKDYNILNCRPIFREDRNQCYNVYNKLNYKLKELISYSKDKDNIDLYKSHLQKVNEYKRNSLK